MWKALFRSTCRSWVRIEKILTKFPHASPLLQKRQTEYLRTYNKFFAAGLTQPLQKRFPLEFDQTLWQANYGIHGNEIFVLNHCEGTWGLKKLVGDANVPDGELTIRTRCIPDSDSSQTFSAQIQVADFGFKDNKWLDGQIIIKNDHSFSFKNDLFCTEYEKIPNVDIKKNLSNLIRQEKEEMSMKKLEQMFDLMKYLNERLEHLERVLDKQEKQNAWVQRQLDALQDTSTEAQAHRYVKNCWDCWLNHSDEEIVTVFSKALNEKKSDVSKLEGFNQVIKMEPNYAEGWNQRSILHFNLTSWDFCLWDVDRTLSLEPRHFGALWRGFHTCRQMLGSPNYSEEKHISYLERYTKLCPFDDEAEEELKKLKLSMETIIDDNVLDVEAVKAAAEEGHKEETN